MNHIKRVLLTTLLIFVFVIPTSVYASSNTTQSSSSESFLTNFLSYFNFVNRDEDYDNQNNHNYYESNTDDWLISLVNWFKFSKDGNYNDWEKEQCTNAKWGWGNHDGCIDSAEIWKRWYCL
jgi:hypothetical protein